MVGGIRLKAVFFMRYIGVIYCCGTIHPKFEDRKPQPFYYAYEWHKPGIWTKKVGRAWFNFMKIEDSAGRIGTDGGALNSWELEPLTSVAPELRWLESWIQAEHLHNLLPRFTGFPYNWLGHPYIWTELMDMTGHIRDLNIHGFWNLRGVLEPSPLTDTENDCTWILPHVWASPSIEAGFLEEVFSEEKA